MKLFYACLIGIGFIFMGSVGLLFWSKARTPSINIPSLVAPTSTIDVPLFRYEPEEAFQAEQDGPVLSLPFTYQPLNSAPEIWPPNGSRLLLPARLRSTPDASVHAFIFLHDANTSDLPAEDLSLPFLKKALARVATTKNIVIMIPHHNGKSYDAFDVQTFSATALRALRTVIPEVTVIDTVVGGHGDATCNGTLTAVANKLTIPLRGVVVYDGCLVDVLTPTSSISTIGTSLLLNPDLIGMGGDDLVNVPGSQSRAELVRQEWKLFPFPCSPCVSSLETPVHCFGPRADFLRPNGTSLISFETRLDHKKSVGLMTNIAFCALYNEASAP